MTEITELTKKMDIRKPYLTPAIVHELDLETHAGSPLGIPDPMNEDYTIP